MDDKIDQTICDGVMVDAASTKLTLDELVFEVSVVSAVSAVTVSVGTGEDSFSSTPWPLHRGQELRPLVSHYGQELVTMIIGRNLQTVLPHRCTLGETSACT